MRYRAWFVGGALALLGLGSETPSALAEAGDKQETAENDAAGVVTAEDGPRLVDIGRGTRLALEPGARIKLGRTSNMQLGDPRGESLTRHVEVLSGRVLARVPASGTAVLLAGPHGVGAITRAGELVVSLNGGEVAVQIVRGEGLLGNGNRWLRARAGVPKLFSRQLPRGRDLAPLPAPGNVVPKPAISLLRDGPTAAGVSWDPVPGAERYVVRVHGEGEPVVVVTRREAADVELRTPGAYTVEVVALDAFGFVGAVSRRLVMYAVSASLPPGGAWAGDGLSLPAGRRARLTGVEGLLANFSGTSDWVPAPEHVVAPERGVILRLRSPSGQGELALPLRQRTLAADVGITPRRAVWPRDEVSVQVRLTDSSGAAVPRDLLLDAKVTINSVPVELRFERRGETLWARVPPPAGHGPWVVRVRVRDQHGLELGRQSLEVATEGPPPRVAARRSGERG